MNTLMVEPAIQIRGMSFGYNGMPLFERFDLALDAGSVTAVLGRSGVGKSTLARLLVGDLMPGAGEIVRGRLFSALANVVYVDQDPMNSVFPWQSVRKNIAYPLRVLGWPSSDLRSRTDQLLMQFKLSHRAAALPRQLSGGELQRLAMARSLSWKPRLIVLDETLVGLDRPLREEALAGLKAITVLDGTTVVLITHSITDAVDIATRCLVLGGRPAGVVLDLAIGAHLPRNENVPEIRNTQDALLEALRSELVD